MKNIRKILRNYFNSDRSRGEKRQGTKNIKGLIALLMAVVVILTTGALIYPASALGRQQAESDPGIVLGGQEECEPGKAAYAKEETADLTETVGSSSGDLDNGTDSDADASDESDRITPDSKSNSDSGAESGSDQKVSGESVNTGSDSDSGTNAQRTGAGSDSDTGSQRQQTDNDTDPSAKTSSESDGNTPGKADDQTVLTFEGTDYSVTASIPSGAKLPEDVKMQVREIRQEFTSEKEQYQEYADKALEEIQKEEKNRKSVAYARFFDITFVKDGVEYEPEAAVDVKITLDKEKNPKKDDTTVADLAKDSEAVKVVHFVEDEKKDSEITEVEKLDNACEKNREKGLDVSFEAPSFSVYGVVYTVDFHAEVLTASGDTYEVTVRYEADAGIPDSAELRVREILPEEEEYKAVQEKAGKELAEEMKKAIPAHPVLLDIAIYDGEMKIEPAEGSKVQVEVKLVKDSITGIYSDEDSPILVNDMPFKADEQEFSQELKIIHDVNDAELDIVDLQEDTDEEHVIGHFDTESFSNWLIYLDEDLEEITIGQGDSITLRPYSEWIWDQKETVDGQTVRWKTITGYNGQPTINTNGIMTVTPNYNYHDDQLDQTYDSYTLTTNGTTGTFNLERENGEIIKVTVTNNPASAKPGVVPFENTVHGLTVNMFNYDADHSLDNRYNVASYIDSSDGRTWSTFSGPDGWNKTTYYQQGPYANDGINNGSALKFLGWGSSNGGKEINNYDATHVTTNIVQSTLTTGTDGKKYPRLNGNGNTSLEYLFSTGSALHSDASPTYNVPGLFQQDDDGYYYFNSNSNYAYLEDGQFKLYEHTYSQKTGNGITSKPIGFFPYHDFDSNNNLSPNHDHALDHHFGMSMEVKFVLPEGKVLHKPGGATEPIVFEFSGDDDMWVFVTDNETNTDMLALDVGGIHQPLTGNIDFTNDSRFVAGKEYTLRIFYVERGGCDSNCSIRFNIPLTKRPFTFEKQDAQDKTKFLKGAKFGLFKDADCKIPAVDDMTGIEYTATADDDGVVSFYVSIGNYYMKELEAPAGYRLDETVRRVVLTENGVTIQGDQDGSREGVQIANRKNPELTVEKEWQTQGGTVITAPQGASATFQLKRYVRYEGEEEITDPSQPVTFKVYRYREGHTPKQVGSDYTFKGGTTVDVNWGYADYYNNWNWESVKHYKENPSGNYIYKTDPVTITLPATGEAAIYIRDENVDEEYRWGEGVKNITVSGTPYEPSTIIRPVSTDWAEDTEYTGSIVTLPQDKIDAAHPWTGKFTNLTVTEIKEGITYHYKYYIVETDRTPANSQIVYVDGSGQVISDPSSLRTDTDSTQKIINKVPNGSIKLRKWVTIGGVSPEDEPDLKNKADGNYTFEIAGIAGTSTAGITKTVRIQISNGKAVKAWVDNVETSFDNEQDLFVEIPDLTPGDYKITETSSVNDVWLSSISGGKNDGDIDTQSVTVTVTSGQSGDSVGNSGKATFTNNYSPDSEEDIAHISIKKTFTGLPDDAVLDNDFKITLKVNNKTYELTSNPSDPAVTFDGSGFPVCRWTVSVKGMLKDAQVEVQEVDAGYPAYDVTTSINGEENTSTYTGSVSSSTVIQAFNPTIYEPNNKKDFNVNDTKIFMALLTDGHVLVISKNKLSLSERAKIEELLAGTGEQQMQEGNWGKKLPPYYYTVSDNRPVHFKGSTITYNNVNVHFDKKCQWTHTAEVGLVYQPGNPADFNFVNDYSQKAVSLDIIKVDAENPGTKLPGAQFTIRRIKDALSAHDVEYDGDESAPQTTGNNGDASFGNLTQGYYEIAEKKSPDGYVISGDNCFYIKVDEGVIYLLKKDLTKDPKEWDATQTVVDNVTFIAATETAPATAQVGNTPGAALPSTGGPGTRIFTILGSILILGAGALLWRRRRTI